MAPPNGNRQPLAGPLPNLGAPQAQYVEDWFIYGINALAIAPGANVNANIQIQADSDFKLIKLSLMADIALASTTASTLVIPNATIQIVDTGSGRQLFFQPVPLGALFGTGSLPHILPVPRIFKARSNIALQFANYDAAVTYNIRMAFEGSKIFSLGS
jgi:hypothetical protein